MLLFTCATSRPVHLELTPDMKVPAFERAFRGFCSRRGVPDLIVSDNFKTFKSQEIKRFMVCRCVVQKFILPASPLLHGVGWILQTVSSFSKIKLSLRKVLSKSFVSFEELQTIE